MKLQQKNTSVIYTVALYTVGYAKPIYHHTTIITQADLVE